MKVSRSVLLSVLATAVVCTGVGAAIAGTSSGGPTIHACAAKHGGALRIARKCTKSELAVSWSRTGPAGPRGASGAQGAQGASGINGNNGNNGVDGTARAYADVSGAVGTVGHLPSLNTAESKGFTAVTEPFPGDYCLTAPGINGSTTAAVVGSVFNSGFAGELTEAELWPVTEPNPTICTAGQFRVIVLGLSGTPPQAQSTPNVDFTIAVP